MTTKKLSPILSALLLGHGCQTTVDTSEKNPASQTSDSGEPTDVLDDCDPCDLQLYTNHLFNEHGIPEDSFTIMTSGDFAFWWDARFDIADEVQPFAELVETIQRDLESNGVQKPWAFYLGYYTNIYIHRGEDDIFPSYCGNGTGYGGDDVVEEVHACAYVTHPYEEDMTDNKVNVYHEVFHVLQAARFAGATIDERMIAQPEFPENEDSGWAVEALAELYQMSSV